MRIQTALIALVLIAQPAPVDPTLIRSTVESLASVIDKEYFDVAVAAKIDAALKNGLTAGRYSLAPSLAALAGALNRELFAIAHDKHLNVAVKRLRTQRLPPVDPRRTSAINPLTPASGESRFFRATSAISI